MCMQDESNSCETLLSTQHFTTAISNNPYLLFHQEFFTPVVKVDVKVQELILEATRQFTVWISINFRMLL